MSDLGLAFPSRRGEIALAIRSTIAELADVPASSICAHHTFAEDFAGRGIFDESLDTVEFVMTLEERIGRRLRDEIAERLPGVLELDFPHPLYTVADVIIVLMRFLFDEGIVV